MDNFEKASIITEVAYNKNMAKFLPRDEQILLNTQLKNKLLRFVGEMVVEENRPLSMKLFDEMMNGMHGQRVRDLFMFRREGNHVVALLCNSIPPELIYAVDNFIPVSVCMGGGEVECYTDDYAKDMCSPTRSMLGFQSTGMCVFFNISDYVIGSDLCSCIKKTAGIIQQSTNDFEVFCTESNPTNKDLNVNHLSFNDWINKITKNKGFKKEKLIEYCSLYTEIRATYHVISELRKLDNPPINGRNSLWTQQLFLVEEPKKLLNALKKLHEELILNTKENIGFNKNGTKKRVMLITPRIMPPFTEIFRLIENCNAIIVCEQTCMGISNINYNFEELLEITNDNDKSTDHAISYLLEHIDRTECSCSSDYDIGNIMHNVSDYNVDAVINYTFKNCPKMEFKTTEISKLLDNKGIPSITIHTNYLEIYENEELLIKKINNFLEF
jgi:benzoyl-CoA reductase/2-hydroxyglutaryl-CoA dehydratase subunit BcrC/BadD/HgdB